MQRRLWHPMSCSITLPLGPHLGLESSTRVSDSSILGRYACLDNEMTAISSVLALNNITSRARSFYFGIKNNIYRLTSIPQCPHVRSSCPLSRFSPDQLARCLPCRRGLLIPDKFWSASGCCLYWPRSCRHCSSTVLTIVGAVRHSASADVQ